MGLLESRYIRATMALLGIGFIVFSLFSDGQPMEELASLSPTRLALAAGAVLVAVLAAALSWSLIVQKPFALSGRVMLESLPAKYVPGGLGLPLSQMNFETRQGDAVNRTLSRMVQNFLVSVSAGGAATLMLQIARGSAPSWQIVVAWFLTSVLPMAHPRALGLVRPTRLLGSSFAPWTAVMAAFAVTFVGLLAMAFGYHSVLAGFGDGGGGAAPAFALAWTVGFVAVPVPAGLGLRESVLIGALPTLPPSVIVLAAVVFRLIAIVAEVIVAAFAYLAPRVAHRGSSTSN